MSLLVRGGLVVSYWTMFSTVTPSCSSIQGFHTVALPGGHALDVQSGLPASVPAPDVHGISSRQEDRHIRDTYVNVPTVLINTHACTTTSSTSRKGCNLGIHACHLAIDSSTTYKHHMLYCVYEFQLDMLS
jgi:hypothetical protein